MTFKGLQDMAIRRFKESLRSDLKEWINFVAGEIWAAEDWTFKKATAAVNVTVGSSAVTGLPGDFGVPELLQNTAGDKLPFLEPYEFRQVYQGDTNTGSPEAFTVVGAGLDAHMTVGPISNETASYSLLYERDHGYYPSTTLTGAQTLPAATVTVASTAAAPSAGTILLGGRPVTYTGKGGTTFTGCAGGTGTFPDASTVTILSPQAGLLASDSDVPLLPVETHLILVHAAQAIGQSLENDYSIYLSDDRVQQGLEAMRRRYLVSERGETVQWGDGRYAYMGW